MNIYILNATITGKIMTEILCESKSIKGIITLKREKGPNITSEYYDYSTYCKKKNIKFIEVESYGLNNAGDKEILEKLDIDLLIVASWQRLIPDYLISKCSLGVIGSHGSAHGITAGRGRSPQNWALLLGEKEFWISIFWINSGIDDGEIIGTEKFEYTETDDIMTSYIKVNILVAKMIIENIDNNRIIEHYGTKQTGNSLYLPQRIKSDGRIDWNRSCDKIYNFVRALTKPYQGAYTVYNNTEIIIYSAVPVNMLYGYKKSEPGEVLSVLNGSILVKCGEGFLLIKEMSDNIVVKEGIIFESCDYRAQMKEIVSRHQRKYDLPISNAIMDEIIE